MVTDTAVEKELTQKQERFSVEYYRTGDGTQSAITAGYSRKSASKIASQNLAKPEIKARIHRLRAMEVKLAIADVDERKEILTEVYRAPLPEVVSARDHVYAIDVHNRLDGAYPPEKRQVDLLIDVAFKVGKGYLTGEQSPVVKVLEIEEKANGDGD